MLEFCRYSMFGSGNSRVEHVAMMHMRHFYYVLIITVLLFACILNEELSATMLYTTVGSGFSHRGANGADIPFQNGFLSPVIEVGARIGRDEFAGFYVRFLLDPENTSHVSSYYLTGKWNYFYFADVLYVGMSGGMHIESGFNQENDNVSTVSSEEAQFLFTAALHAGVSLEIMRYHYLVFEGFATFSIGGSMQGSVNCTIGIMSMF